MINTSVKEFGQCDVLHVNGEVGRESSCEYGGCDWGCFLRIDTAWKSLVSNPSTCGTGVEECEQRTL